MVQPKSKYRAGSRAARFLVIRDAVLAHSGNMRQIGQGWYELAVGPFLIHYAVPGALGPGRPFNMAIWPGGAQEGGHIVQTNKVANVDWDQRDNVDIVSYRSGPWEGQLLALLSDSTITPFKR